MGGVQPPVKGGWLDLAIELQPRTQSKVFWFQVRQWYHLTKQPIYVSAFVEGESLLDNQYFIRQTILPTYFSESQQFLFARFFRVGIEYSFK